MHISLVYLRPSSDRILDDRFLISGNFSRVVTSVSDVTRLSMQSVLEILSFSMSSRIKFAAFSFRCDFLREYLGGKLNLNFKELNKQSVFFLN